ncbi:MAG: excinuclease ABC subunit UvrA, partial [Eubacteriales bacterium]
LEETMLASDYIVDIGPGAGIHGGEIVACGTPKEVMKKKGTATADFLSGRRRIAIPEKRRPGDGRYLEVRGAREHNLKNIDVKIPLGVFTCVTGVSGSGKSSLINGIVLPALSRELNGSHAVPGKHGSIEGVKLLDKVISIDQSPIGRTPRSNPATYTGLFTDIRTLFASTQDAQIRGFKQDRFSFNLKGGRCEACQGDGTLKIEMHFLPDVYVTCDTCHGKRYNRETLEVKYKGKNISDVLEMTVDEGCEFFANLPKLYRRLKTLQDVGLGYIKIGQSSTTLSGGEAQRVKLATELSKVGTGNTMYILDEPTTGLHTADVEKLIEVLKRLVSLGNSVLVIEHNLDMIKTADYIIDLGPEGGDAGGTVVATGTPEEVAMCEKSYTGIYLKKMLSGEFYQQDEE